MAVIPLVSADPVRLHHVPTPGGCPRSGPRPDEGPADPTRGAAAAFGAGTFVLTPPTPPRILRTLPADQCQGCAYHPADAGLSPAHPWGRQPVVSGESRHNPKDALRVPESVSGRKHGAPWVAGSQNRPSHQPPRGLCKPPPRSWHQGGPVGHSIHCHDDGRLAEPPGAQLTLQRPTLLPAPPAGLSRSNSC